MVSKQQSSAMWKMAWSAYTVCRWCVGQSTIAITTCEACRSWQNSQWFLTHCMLVHFHRCWWLWSRMHCSGAIFITKSINSPLARDVQVDESAFRVFHCLYECKERMYQTIEKKNIFSLAKISLSHWTDGFDFGFTPFYIITVPLRVLIVLTWYL